ncbi:hypothetical protein CMV_027157 [Castanea mollissima]|uniref:Alpha-glucan water dikinase-like N-terminal Ig-like domain-containing protein n=1 Tax=Castanea mollissima TaxID=60419 RepID=A0A8J4QAI5_9ROSI|nr:hypothetical protein CMV_027157 [Castanea mollissima]
MASSKATSSTQVPRAHHFELVEGMQLQINVTGSSSGRYARIELQLKNCTTTWILHWGYLLPWKCKLVHSCGSSFRDNALHARRNADTI